MMQRGRVLGGLAVAGVGALALLSVTARAGPWSTAYRRALPDSAFAVVEVRPDGTRARHLPHHDADGRVDLGHLRSALGRLSRMPGLAPAVSAQAREHLLEHLRAATGGAAGAFPREPPPD
jgi:hypothetical protein